MIFLLIELRRKKEMKKFEQYSKEELINLCDHQQEVIGELQFVMQVVSTSILAICAVSLFFAFEMIIH